MAKALEVAEETEYVPLIAMVKEELGALHDKLLNGADLADRMLLLVEATGQLYRYDADSSATAEDYRVVETADSTGRWMLCQSLAARSTRRSTFLSTHTAPS